MDLRIIKLTVGEFFALAILSLSHFSPQLWQNWTIQKYRCIWSTKKVNDIPGWQPGLVPEGWCAVQKGRCFPALPGGHCREAKAAFIFHWGSPGAQWMVTVERTCRILHCFIHLSHFLIRSLLQKKMQGCVCLGVAASLGVVPKVVNPGTRFSSFYFTCLKDIESEIATLRNLWKKGLYRRGWSFLQLMLLKTSRKSWSPYNSFP